MSDLQQLIDARLQGLDEQELREGLAGAVTDGDRVRWQWLLAYPPFLGGDQDEGLRRLEQAWQQYQDLGLDDEALEAELRVDLAELGGSLDHALRGLELKARLAGGAPEGRSCVQVGEALVRHHRVPEAVPYFQRAITLLAGAERCAALASLGRVYSAMLQPRKALAMHREALELSRQCEGGDPGWHQHDLGVVLIKLGQSAGAATHLEDALNRRAGQPDRLAATGRALAHAYDQLRRPTQVDAVLTRVIGELPREHAQRAELLELRRALVPASPKRGGGKKKRGKKRR